MQGIDPEKVKGMVENAAAQTGAGVNAHTQPVAANPANSNEPHHGHAHDHHDHKKHDHNHNHPHTHTAGAAQAYGMPQQMAMGE